MALFQEAIIKKHLLTLDAHVLDSAYNEYKRVYSPEKIKNIRVAKEEQYQEGFIKEIFGSVLDRNVLEDAVEKKHDAIERWHCSVKYDKRWLLLISTGEQSSIFSNYRIDEIDWNRFNKFDKIFIFDDFMRRIVFLQRAS